MRKIFLACPYSHNDSEVIEGRFIECNKVAARIIESGAAVYSQVSMSHPINQAIDNKSLSEIGQLWGPVDAVFMAVMDELIVLDLPGWAASTGIKREMEFFQERGKRVSLWSEVENDFARRQ
ncbi:DUF1937 family protein [Mycolicibacterium sp. YH-1]|uniref:DUF1937 family protein n=1 Tax=Mycolicibacterium sp. YH-1 TaxID=2908837 RepID=UPI001F4BDCBF|nr:DUF1937 family protein [Mycolicibacterium sp. YH-1]UNB52958.1 DUF1937 family protein [Mycolicibacterium sp. YH-1]